jgi:2Fe-2S ferredoxin
MPRLVVTERGGATRVVDAKSGESVMANIRDAGIYELAALCGGCCSCGTCHVYVDPKFVGRLKPPESDEVDLLECSEHRKDASRLSCQIVFDNYLDGLHVTVAPEG